MRKNLPKVAAAACLWTLLTLHAVACGASGSNGSSAEESPQEMAAIAEYRSYLEKNSASLVRDIQAMLPEIEHGRLTRAESRYARARVRYAEVEPFASTLGKLDSDIDRHADEASKSGLRGFHRIEGALWREHSAAGMTPIARQLLADARRLEERARNAVLTGAGVAAGAANAMTTLSASTLTGKTEPYSRTALVDAAGNVEGAEAALKAIKPVIGDGEELQKEIEAQLEKLHAAVDEYGIFASSPEQQRDRSPGVSFTVFTGFSKTEIDRMREPAEALADLFSEVQARLDAN